MDFDLDTVRTIMARLVTKGVIPKIVKNVGDIKYTYDARLDLPESIRSSGHWAWIAVGKGRYKFVRLAKKNLIEIPQDLSSSPEAEIQADQTPPFISQILGVDEQATFTRIRNSNLLTAFLGFPVWQLQGHHRTTVSYGQIEIDEVYAGMQANQNYLVPISGKGGSDKLSYSQALNLNTYGKEKAPGTGFGVRSLGILRHADGSLYFVEFTNQTDIRKIEIVKVRRFRFVGGT
jgi:hypothetical protein